MEDTNVEYFFTCSDCEAEGWYWVNLLDLGVTSCYGTKQGRCRGALSLDGIRRVVCKTGKVLETRMKDYRAG